jgi:hypothetical protein
LKRALVLIPLLLAGCGNSGEDVLRDASANIGKIRAGTLHAQLLVTPHVQGAKNPFGWRVDGPFTFGDEPTARVRYTQIANGKQGSATLVLERDGGYALVNGQRRELSASDLEDLRSTARTARGGGSVVDISLWIDSAHKTDCPEADAPVECVKGDLDPVETVAGLAALAQLTGTRGLADADQETLRKAVDDATFFAMSGKDDHLLRDLRIDMGIGLDVPQSLRTALGKLVGADVSFELAIDDPKT